MWLCVYFLRGFWHIGRIRGARAEKGVAVARGRLGSRLRFTRTGGGIFRGRWGVLVGLSGVFSYDGGGDMFL